MNTFCTIITSDHLPYAVSLYKSLRQYDATVTIWVLIADNIVVANEKERPGFHLITAESIQDSPLIGEMYKKYAHTSADYFRWAAKPVFMLHLLGKGYDKVLYADCDIFFFGNYQFLFDELDGAAILLTPHWGVVDPEKAAAGFIRHFTHGIFNAGFVGASAKGSAALHWWAKACHYKMGEHPELGIHDDQKYLDIFPALFEDTMIIRHKGCNVLSLENVAVSDAGLIEGIYPLVFAHFTSSSLRNIQKGQDPALLPYFNLFKKTVEEEGNSLHTYMQRFNIPVNITVPMKIKWTLRIRTRIRRLLYKLAGSI